MEDKGKLLILSGFWLTIALLTILAFAGIISPHRVDSSNNQTDLLARVTVVAGSSAELTVQFEEPVTSLHASLSPDNGNRDAVVGALDLPGNMEDVAIDRDRRLAFLANSYTGVQIVDISNPSNIRLISSLATPGNAWDILVRDHLLFVAAAKGGLQIIDTRSPEHPIRVGELTLPGMPFLKLALHSNTLYVSCGKKGLLVVDITDVEHPRRVKTIERPNGVWGILTTADHLYATSDRYQLEVFSLVDPQKPKPLRHLEIPDLAWDMACQRRHLFVPTREAGLLVFNIDDPANPRKIDLAIKKDDIEAISIDGDIAFVSSRKKGVSLLDISDPAVPRKIRESNLYFTPRNMVLLDNLAYIAAGLSGLRVVATDKIAQTSSFSSLPVPGVLHQVLFDESYFYMATARSGLYVARRDDDEQLPTIVASLPLPGLVQNMVRAGDYLFFACSTSGLQIVDISDPLAPRLAGSMSHQGSFVDVAISGTNLYAAMENDTLLVANITFPENPILLGQLSLPGAMKLAIRNDRLYVASSANGIYIFDISNLSSPLEISHASLPWPFQEFATFRDIAVNGETVYLAAGEGELIIYDISDETRPSLFEIAHIEGEAMAVAVSGEKIYVTTRQGQLWQMERVDGSLVRRGIVDILGNCRNIKFLADKVVLANGMQGVSLVSDPSQLDVRLQSASSRLRTPTTAKIYIPPRQEPGVYNLALFEQGKLREFVGAVRVTEKQAK